MDSAIHKDSGKEYFAWQIWNPGLFKNKDVHKEKWIVPSDEIENYDQLKNKEILVTPVISHLRGNIRIPAFFRLLPGNKENIIFRGESDKHKKLKTFVSVFLTEEFDCKLSHDNELTSLSTLPIDYELLKNNFKKTEVRKNLVTTGEYKQADVLIPFVFNPFWGNGIVIEIRVSEDEEEESEKEKFWFQRCYSMIWLDEDDFDVVDGRYGFKYNIVPVIPFSVGYAKILDEYEGHMHSYLHGGYKKLEELREEIDEQLKTLEHEKSQFFMDIDANLTELRRTCRTCIHGKKDNRNPDLIACWENTYINHNGKKAPTKHEPLDGCTKHANC